MGGNITFIFPDCREIKKSLQELCRQNGIKTFMFVIPDKDSKPRHIVSFMGVFDEKTNQIVITVKTEKKKQSY